jgi:hypothetical protein
MDRQAEDRCHRIGQQKPVTIYRCYPMLIWTCYLFLLFLFIEIMT